MQPLSKEEISLAVNKGLAPGEIREILNTLLAETDELREIKIVCYMDDDDASRRADIYDDGELIMRLPALRRHSLHGVVAALTTTEHNGEPSPVPLEQEALDKAEAANTGVVVIHVDYTEDESGLHLRIFGVSSKLEPDDN